jgi:NitT/TauT family transport system substrate-binding protein
MLPRPRPPVRLVGRQVPPGCRAPARRRRLILQIEAGDPLVVLAGAHVGCFELFGTNGVHAIRDLKGRTVGVPEPGGSSHVFLASLLAHVGLDPRTDVTWATHEGLEAMQLLADGKIDGYLGFPPEPQQLRARGIGQVVVNSLVDRPWSQYFCCMVIANRHYVAQHPVATARALRGILTGLDVSGRDPDGAVRYLVETGYTTHRTSCALRSTPSSVSPRSWGSSSSAS